MSRQGEQNPNYKDGRTRTRLYKIWVSMKQRCQNEKNHGFLNYGQRGINVCDLWRDSFIEFKDWSLANDYASDLEIDRKDNDGPYAPWNCHWATKSKNCRNTRRNVLVSAFGETKTIVEWSEDRRCIVKHGTLRTRLSRGTIAEDAITSRRIVANQFIRRCA